MLRNLITALLMTLATSAGAQHAHQSDLPMQTGQSQFAAVAEIVTLLRDNPHTNWAEVNIAALHDHLMDMDNVTTKAKVKHRQTSDNVAFVVTGTPTVTASIKRMTKAHGPMLSASTGWAVDVQEQSDGVVMTVTPTMATDLAQISGLGFFGLMTIGAHHQQHHLMIAKGHAPH